MRQRLERAHVAARDYRFVLIVNAIDPPQLNTHPGTLSRSRYVAIPCRGLAHAPSRRQRLGGCMHEAPASRTSACLAAGRHSIRFANHTPRSQWTPWSGHGAPVL